MKKIALFTLFCCFFAAFAQKTDKGDYKNYETEDVTPLRQDITPFEMPMVTPEPEVPSPVSVNKWEKVEPYFVAGNKVYVDANPELGRFVEKHKAIIRTNPTTFGYRVQIFAGLEREAANKRKSLYMNSIGGDCDMTFDDPMYRIRAGSFLTRSEAEAFCNRVRRTVGLEGAFVVRETIRVRQPRPLSLPMKN
ncbi:MAG: SPOR domain-containing protein [Bacteroidia bacterium]